MGTGGRGAPKTVDRLIASRAYREIISVIAGGVGYLLLVAGSVTLTRENGSLSPIWPANALLLALMMRIEVRRWPAHMAAAFVGGISANYLVFGTIVAPIYFSVANMVEVTLAALLLRAADIRGNPLCDIRTMVRFAVFGPLIAPAVSGLAGAAIVHLRYDVPFWPAYAHWYGSDALGLLIFTPLFSGILSGEMEDWLRQLGRRGRIEAVAILAATVACGLFVFFAYDYPTIFVLTAPLMLATFRLGQFGAKIALILLALIAMTCTTDGHGPIAALIADRDGQALFIQFFIAVMLLTTLPIVAELNERRALARRLAESEASLRLLASESADALVRLDEQGRCLQCSAATPKLFGAEEFELVHLASHADPRDGRLIDQALAQALADPGQVVFCEFRPRLRPDDWLECTLRALVDREGRPYGAVGAIRDVTIRKEREQLLSVAASTDSLTGAVNHATFMAHLDRALAHLGSSHLALIMIDIDHFKQVNDRHGHPDGDRVLVELCARLRSLVRDHDIIGRLGGDEIAILLDGTGEELALTIAEAIRLAIGARPILLRGDIPLLISISCGVAQAYPGIGREELLRKADEALYQAKGGGRDRVVISGMR